MQRPLDSLKQRFGHVDFRRQLSIVLTLAIAGVALASAVVSSWQGSRQARDILLAQGLNLAASLARQSPLALLTASADNAHEATDSTLAFPDVAQVELLFPDGRVLLRSGAPAGPAVPPAQADTLAQAQAGPRLEAETADFWFFVAPVRTQSGAALDPFEMRSKGPELIGYVRVVQSKVTLTRLVWQLVFFNFGLALAFTLLSLWLLRRMTQRLMRPLRELGEVMAQARSGESGLRAPLAGPPDIAHMAQAFNEMMRALEQREHDLQLSNESLAQHATTLETKVAERTAALRVANDELQATLDSLKATQAHLLESEKLASLGRLVAGVAHELNTPLGNALTASTTLEAAYQSLNQMVDSGTMRRSEFQMLVKRCQDGYSLVSRNLHRAGEVVRGFKQLAVDQSSEMRRRFDLAGLLHDIIGTLEPSLRHAHARVEMDVPPGLEMDSFPGPLGQVIVNLTTNALMHAFAGRAHGVIRLQAHLLEDGQRVCLVFSDDGVGMGEEVRRRIFEAFFTTRFGQGGSGLGMQIVHSFVNGILGGHIKVESEPGVGSSFVITLPVVAPEADLNQQ